MDIIVLVLALFLLGFLCFKNVPTPIGGLVCAVLIMLYFGMNVYETLMGVYMPGFVSFCQKWFLMFLFGALLGKITEISGAADSLASAILDLVGEKRISLGICIVAFVFTAAGISVYITLFIILPIAIKMCKKANLSRCFIVGGYSLGINIGLGLPAVGVANNILCTGYFGTELTAGGWLAVFCNLIFATCGMFWLTYWERRCAKRGMGFVATQAELDLDAKNAGSTGATGRPHWLRAIIPMCVPLVCLNVLKMKVEYALLLSAVTAIILQWSYLPKAWGEIRSQLVTCINNTTVTVINTCAVVGFGTVVIATPGYELAVSKILSINGNPLFVALLATTLLAGVAGSSQSGIILASDVLVQFLPLTSPSALHRTVIYGSLGLDSLPNAGFLQTEFNLAGVSFKEVYLPIVFMLTVVMTLGEGILYAGLCVLLGIA